MSTGASEPESSQPVPVQTQPLTGTTWPRPPWYVSQPASENKGPSVRLPALSATPNSPATPVFLTPLYANDAAPMQHLLSNPLVAAGLLNVPTPYTIEQAHHWINLNRDPSSSSLLAWAIRTHYPNDAGLYIGGLSLTRRDEAPDGTATYELGYSLSPEFWGKGIMKNASVALLTWATEEAGVEEVFVRVETSNGRSKGVIDGIPGFVGEEDQEVDWKGEKRVIHCSCNQQFKHRALGPELSFRFMSRQNDILESLYISRDPKAANMALNQELSALYNNFHNGGAPKEVSQTILESAKVLQSDFTTNRRVIQAGEELPAFTLPDATGKSVASASLLESGPILISFYRGDWCPYCNIELRGLQKRLPDFKAKGVTLVAITPQLPDTALTTVEKHSLEFPVLSDAGNAFARQLGLVHKQPEGILSLHKSFGIDYNKINGDESHEIPFPATILVDAKGIVRNVFVDADITKRLEPDTALEWTDAL
ncbi:hypothetical protein V492_02618 [Pseudogymnoascus sp. VKM F-4246]|nr:hypothetical protein V492_02618 [Pseudogymnoascus sp. VKM F-4246]